MNFIYKATSKRTQQLPTLLGQQCWHGCVHSSSLPLAHNVAPVFTRLKQVTQNVQVEKADKWSNRLLERLKIKEIRISENRPLINNFSLEITFLSFLKTKIILIWNDLSQINYYKNKTKAINTRETWVVLSKTHRKRYLGCCDFFYQWAFKRIENRISHLPKISSGMALPFLSDRSALMIDYYILTKRG